MAQVKLLKISSDGIPLEMDTANDDVTLKSYTVTGGGPVLSGTGLDMNNTDVSDVQDLVFTAPSTGTINQTAGNLIVDDIMAKERSNTLTTAADILFPVIADSAGEVDAFRLPAIPGVPSATPTASGEGFIVWDSSDDKLYVWDGAAWKDQSIVTEAERVENSYLADTPGVTANDAVYISAADSVSPAKADASATSYAIGFAADTAASGSPTGVVSEGLMSGFSGLTGGTRYYLSGATAGQITSTLPVGSGHTIVLMGIAKNATDLQVRIEELGRRA